MYLVFNTLPLYAAFKLLANDQWFYKIYPFDLILNDGNSVIGLGIFDGKPCFIYQSDIEKDHNYVYVESYNSNVGVDHIDQDIST